MSTANAEPRRPTGVGCSELLGIVVILGLVVVKISDPLLETRRVKHSNAVGFTRVGVQVNCAWGRAIDPVVNKQSEPSSFRVTYGDFQSAAVLQGWRTQFPDNWKINPDVALNEFP